ncbi:MULTISPECIES: helix-turn-helix domain-containing protein [unclassified Prochlorococcus]|uniref:helix-turn-helix domain-containing protein n=1 Tax=unclassified Prochlorococcus TaxID=2627481 RepID=UPI0005339E3C|nr:MULTISPECIES: helix-turn-helix domain-containing protein [unclassified Prochlorococcus]KGG16156.1 hypothetical protein EV06_0866 [Prochlorococcus sp. MIT 0602]KGG17276.1 hypothetical protein EV07_0714 [Prochlorococcus sp. MIT 0603]
MNEKQFKVLKQIGQMIREAREKDSLSIESLSKNLYIPKERLIALEEAQQQNLPEMVFIIGMIRRISDYLKIDSTELIYQLKDNSLSPN